MQEFRQLWSYLRLRVPDRSPIGLLRTFPASILLVTVIICCSLVTRHASQEEFSSVLGTFGMDWRTLADGDFGQIFTGSFIQSDPGIQWTMILMIVTAFTLCELMAGSIRTLISVYLSDWICSVLTVIALRILAGNGMERAIPFLMDPDAGSSAAAHGAYAVAASLLPGRLAFVAWGILFAITILLLFQQSLDAAIVHLFAVCFGGVLGWFVWRPRIAAELTPGQTETSRVPVI